MINESIKTIRIKLSNIPNAFKQQGVSELTRPGDELVKLTISRQHISVSLVGGQIDREGYQLFANDLFGAMDDELVNQWDAICVSKGRFCLIFKTQMIEQLDDLRSEAWCFESVDQFWDHSLVVHLDSDLLVK